MTLSEAVILIYGTGTLLLELAASSYIHAGFNPTTATVSTSFMHSLATLDIHLLILCSSLSEDKLARSMSTLQAMGKIPFEKIDFDEREFRPDTERAVNLFANRA